LPISTKCRVDFHRPRDSVRLRAISSGSARARPALRDFDPVTGLKARARRRRIRGPPPAPVTRTVYVGSVVHEAVRRLLLALGVAT
jgi:hypothetical protein